MVSVREPINYERVDERYRNDRADISSYSLNKINGML